MNFDLEKPIENPEQARAQEAARNLHKIHGLVKAEMAAAQYRHAEGYDRARRPAPKYAPGDKMWLGARHIKTTRPARKLDRKKLGPFPITKAIGSHAYELELPGYENQPGSAGIPADPCCRRSPTRPDPSVPGQPRIRGWPGCVQGQPRIIHLMKNSLPCIVKTTS